MISMKVLFSKAFSEFLSNERTNIINDVNERNLCGRLAIYLEGARQRYGIQGYYADVEYNRKQDGKLKTIVNERAQVIRINCDLILHSRGEIVARDNLIAIEMKKADQPLAEKDSDRKRLRALTRKSYDGIWSADGRTFPEHVCGYEIGFFIILDSRKKVFQVEEYRYGKMKETWSGNL
jgi:hypothetical protein